MPAAEMLPLALGETSLSVLSSFKKARTAETPIGCFVFELNFLAVR